jgi:fructose-1,6-bisphosphatase/inositol monophosphatase family enzyme
MPETPPVDKTSLREHLKFAVGIVKGAGEIFSHHIQSPKIIRRKAAGDLATSGDLEVEKFIGEAIRERYSDHDFITEESEGRSTGSAYEWILDPVDGTKYYARGIPLCAISLGLRIDGKLSVGVVYAPLLGQLFSAASGMGAFLNGEACWCSRQKELDTAIICAEIPNRHSVKEDSDRAFARLRILIGAVGRVRAIGVTSLGLCWTAKGGYDSYVNLVSASRPWDVAAGQVILEESGAKLSRIDGRIVAGSPHLQDKLIRLLQAG